MTFGGVTKLSIYKSLRSGSLDIYVKASSIGLLKCQCEYDS